MPKQTKPWYEIKAAGDRVHEILIYGDIGETWWSDESTTAKGMVAELNDLDTDLLDVRINSYGGVVADGIAIFNALKRHPAAVTTYIDGVAYSIASLMAMAGDEIRISANALMMIHAPWGMSVGNAAEMRKQADVLDKYSAAMTTSYLRDDGPDKAQIEAWLTDGEDHYFSASEAEALGLVDAVDETNEMAIAAAARDFDPTRYKMPQVRNTKNTHKAASKTAKQPEDTKMPDKQADHTDVYKTVATNVVAIQDAAREKMTGEILARNKELETAAAPFQGNDAINTLYMAYLQNPEKTVDEFRVEALAALGAKSEPTQERVSSPVTSAVDARDKFKVAATNVLQVRAGLTDNTDLSKNEFSAFSLAEMARKSLALGNVDTSGMDRMQLVGTALAHSTSDFPYILEDTANKAMLRGYEEAPEDISWTRPGNLSDFKTASRTGLSEFSDLEEVTEDGEFKHGTLGERREQITLVTYGKLFRYTRQSIVNDDLSAFTTTPRKMGRAALRKVADLAWGVLTANAAMADAVALFHADHSNLAGTGAAPTMTTVGAGRTAMRIQTDSSGNAILNIRPAFLLGPAALEDTLLTLMSAEDDPSISTRAGKPNTVRNLATVITDGRLDAASTTAWYLTANAQQFDTVEVAYLDGNTSPYLEEQAGWTIDGREYKVRIDAAAKALDHRTMYKNAGA